MKIDYSCIDHNVKRLIDENSQGTMEILGAEDLERELLVQTGYIRGVIDFAKAMELVLSS